MTAADSKPIRSVYIEEEPMTMQVGMVGSDGVILASDRKVSTDMTVPERLVGSVADVSAYRNKIEISHRQNAAVCCADDLTLSSEIAQQVMAQLQEQDLGNEYAAADAVVRIAGPIAVRERRQVQSILALKCQDWNLFKYHFDATERDSDYRGECCPSRRWEIAGHVTNPAVFLLKHHDDALALDQLVPIAAYLIFCAHHFNSGGVDDLEIVRCVASGARRLTMRSIRELWQKAKEWDAAIRGKLLDYRQPYTYEPV